MPAESGDRRQHGDGTGDLDERAAAAAAESGVPVTERGRSSPEGDRAEPPRRHPYDPRAWALWQRPKRFIAFLFAMEAIGIAIMVVATMNSTTPERIDWVRFAILAVGATAHIQFTQRQEERRRDRSRTVLIDLTAVWTFPAAVILPLSLTLSIIALVRIQHWFIARRPAHNFVFSSVTHGVSVTLASLTFAAFGPHEWGRIPDWGTLGEFGVLIVTGMVFEAVQIAYIGGILAIGSPKRPSMSTVLGNTADNLLEAITIGLGAVTAVLLLIMPPMVIVMAVVTVVFNRLAEIDQLQNDARTDPKTGVLNMRGWSESADRALGRTARSDDSLALLMIDLDHFKWINDTYGHPAGDDVLRDVAQKLDEVTRPADVIGRFGGEEFLVLLPDIDETSAKLAADRVRSAIAELHIVTTDKRGSRVTISGRTASIGAALFPRHGDSLEELLHAADAAVYVAKENGRNQVRFAQDVDRPAPPPPTAET
ncbi:GGDEF domain-containing protein [Amycolatopsis coloradensis]|uniref:GGDEF domain-containing protein n=1 Tax=Amycolatopsis coloradensis TaxID=76021 RepID=A0A1R0KRS8_9PSEU|nr:GGDEF domain-containing protein [Amycolatopsis coloradensis]OLZ50502.1 GGDEF domain-containing protein [Amycolatopsis coloradensis]